jgi:hypothetical protein
VAEVQVSQVDASDLLISGLGLFSIVGLPFFHHTPYLADVTMGTKACNLLKGSEIILN